GVAEKRGTRAERHDPAIALLAHVGTRVSYTVEGALQVYREDGIPLLLAHVEDHPVAHDAGAGHQDVDPPEALDGGVDDAPRAVEVGHRFGIGDRLATGGGDLLRDVDRGPGRRRGAVELDAVIV